MKRSIHMLFAAILLLGMGCAKDKQNELPGHLPDDHNMAASTVRLILLEGKSDLMVNGEKLTSWEVPIQANGQEYPFPTKYFPTSGKLSGTYTLPQQFINGAGQATVKLYIAGSQQIVPPVPDYLLDSFVVNNNYQQPLDYYIGTKAGNNGTGIGSTMAVPRGITAPARPDHIRVRLVNLSLDELPKLTLAYADGSPVSDITSGIDNYKWSDYVELPYGTYQFKVLVDGESWQIPGKTPMTIEMPTPTDFSYSGNQLYYAPVYPYQPGGVYTIVVAHSAKSNYWFGDGQNPTPAFSVITDVTPAANLTYARIQAANAASETGLQWQIDGGAPASVAYATASDYSTLIAGMHTISFTDAKGKKVAEKKMTINAGDNLTLWAYPGNGDSAAITVIQNNMSGKRVMSPNDDGSDASQWVYDPLKDHMLLQTRFLNLCPDLPYITFTGPNGASFFSNFYADARAAQNLRPGQAPDATVIPYPYVDMGIVTGGVVQAFSSRPQVIPGNRLTDVTPLSTSDFVRMPAYYVRNGKPDAEGGVYTVALIGREDATHHPRLIVVKHNQ